MSVDMMRYLAAAILGFHGIGHILAFFPIFGFSLTDEHSFRSWLLTPVLGNLFAVLIEIILFLCATMGFLGAVSALMQWQIAYAFWQFYALTGAAFSLVGLFLFPRAFPTLFPNLVGAVLVDIAILAALLWLRWPPDLLVL